MYWWFRCISLWYLKKKNCIHKKANFIFKEISFLLHLKSNRISYLGQQMFRSNVFWFRRTLDYLLYLYYSVEYYFYEQKNEIEKFRTLEVQIFYVPGRHEHIVIFVITRRFIVRSQSVTILVLTASISNCAESIT